MDRDFVWEGNYGNRSHLISVLKELLDNQNADSLQMMQAFVNNNPYSLEFFLVLSYKNPLEGHIDDMMRTLKNADLVYRPDVTMKELVIEQGNRRFNSSTFIDGQDIDLSFTYLFQIPEIKTIRNQGFNLSSSLGNQLPIFLSHQSKNKAEVEKLIPYLNGEGLSVWIDKYNIDYGESIVEAVQRGIKIAGAVIFWITNDFLNSNWCRRELSSFLHRFAGKSDVLIIPIVSNEVDIDALESIFLSELKYFKRNDEGLKEIAKEIIPSISRFYDKNFKKSNTPLL